MAVIRTRRLAIGILPAGGAGRRRPGVLGTPEVQDTGGYVYQCPSGIQAVIRNVDLWPYTPNVPPDILAEEFFAFASWFITTAENLDVVVGNMVTTSLHTTAQWVGVCVLRPGDWIFVNSSLGEQPLHYQISGAELVIE